VAPSDRAAIGAPSEVGVTIFLAKPTTEIIMNHILKTMTLAFLGATAILASPALAAEMRFPAVCAKTDHSMSMDQPMDMSSMPMKDFQKDFMSGMQKMDPAMMQGMMQDKPDVAFICGMIAHHMGAVQMSEVELKYGKDEWARQLAQKIIDAQMKEIDDMTRWLEKNAK
jgi:uncharacterized protein (DUF305 family)